MDANGREWKLTLKFEYFMVSGGVDVWRIRAVGAYKLSSGFAFIRGCFFSGTRIAARAANRYRTSA
jgi:hypothetical protein